ncbi:E3 ubiquitin-protein ligase TRIM33 [Neodiprion fabricii]|uniref:E3 ubiquitin-protein ligase TRIM33 n=1 Tax=Neodiprion fabricii TaxID=2872261 RepID=UPI001ED92965|nr:E3 ubiquitin-protein ligase TRIM33 [Neodiprion fabricii]
MEQQASEILVTDAISAPMVLIKGEPVEQNANGQELQPVVAQPTYNEEYVEPRIECTTETHESEFRTLLSKCIFCAKTFTPADNSKLLECLHAACAACVTSKPNEHSLADVEVVLESNVIVCQICNVACRMENLIENRFFLKLMDEENGCLVEDLPENVKESGEEEKKCTSCRDNATATSWCVDCEEFICENCVLAHQRLKITKDHTIKPKGELTNDEECTKKGGKKIPGYLFCTVHSHEQLSLFCQTCDRLTCRDCQLSDHRDHKYKFIHEIAAETRTTVSTLLKEVSYKRVLLKSAMKVIEDRQTLIIEKKKNLVQDITHMVVQLTNAINTRGKQLVMRLNEVCDQKQNTLNEKKVALDQLSKLTDHCIQFVNHALDKGSDMALLYSKRSVINHLQRIKSRRADIPNPEIPVRIHLSLDKVPDLIKVVSSIGAIVVDGRVYPSISPTTGPSLLSNQFSEPNAEQKSQQSNNSGPLELSAVPVHIPSPTQHTNILQNPFQQMPHPLTQQQPLQNYSQHYPPHNLPPRSSPQTQLPLPRQPYGLSPNIRLQQPLLISQRPGSCHQQVTSSTHPHQQMHLDQLGQNPSLRGLLAHNPPPYRASSNVNYRLPPSYRYPSNNPHRPLPPHTMYAQTNTALGSGVRMQQCSPTSPSAQHFNYPVHQQPAARWHIPQNLNPRHQSYPTRHSTPPVSVAANDTYKITLKNQSANNQKFNLNTNTSSETLPQSQNSSVGQAVSSSVPKTPSPVPAHAKTDETEKSLDKFCQESVNDLMLTIAKLDSNGIVVIPEAQRGQLDSTQVDSSTDEGIHSLADNASDNSKNSTACMTKDDPNEDWCAVCMDGGDAVLCCDKCPKVFHLYCHIPSLKMFPDESETWQCMLCTNVLDCSEDPPGEKRPSSMSARDLRVAQRIVLELYCQYEHSLPFREVVSSEIVEYHRIIKKPMALDVIRNKLKPDHPNHYTNLRQVMSDIRLMFKNAFTYNPVESQVYQEARNLEEFFEKLLLKWAPIYAYDDPFLTAEGEEEEEVFPPNRKYRRIISD